MITNKIKNTQIITNSDANKYLNDISENFKKRDKELPFEVQQTKEYLAKITKKGATKEKAKQLSELGLDEKTVIELLNIMPESEELIKTILYKKVDDESIIKKIKDILA